MMEMVMGRMPERIARAGARAKPEYFKEGLRLDWPKPKSTKQSKKDVRNTRSLQARFQNHLIHRPLAHDAALQDHITPTDQTNRNFLHLVQRLLAFDPEQRITVKEALNHPYFNIHVPEEI